MKKEVGASAGILALIAVLLHTQLPPGSESTAVSHIAAERTKAATKPPQIKEEPAEGPWIAIRTFLQDPQDYSFPASPCTDPGSKPSCLQEVKANSTRVAMLKFLGFPQPQEADNTFEMWSVIAAVTDPLHTRLPLFLDRQIESIQRSLQVKGWEFAGQWLPWGDHFDAAESDINERRRQRRLQREQEDFPGVLIFRSTATGKTVDKRKMLFLFLVAETPTTGIKAPAFFAALHLASALSTSEKHIGVLAPSFSGSFESLTTVIFEWNNAVAGNGMRRRVLGPVFGGSISSSTAADAFSRKTHLLFHSGIASSRDYDLAFCEVLDTHGIEHRAAAILTEDETGFSQYYMSSAEGRDKKDACNDVPRYAFSRSLQLRNLYEDDAIDPAGKRREGGSRIAFSIKDPNSGEDSMPMFSPQTPISQDAVLQVITEDLKRRRTRVVYLTATNILDVLFVTRVLREECPDTRVLIEKPDVLYMPASARRSLSGTLALSTYPMFLEGDGWLTGEVLSRSVFTSSDFQGFYNATQLMLQGIGAIDGAALRSYRQFGKDLNHPGLWLLTLNRGGYAPLDLIDEAQQPMEQGGERKDHAEWFGVKGPAANDAEVRFATPPRAWFITVVSLTSFVCWAAFLLWRSNFPRGLHWPVWLSLGEGHLLTIPKLVTVTGAALALSSIEWIFGLPVALSNFDRAHSAIWLWATILMLAIGCASPIGVLAAIWLRHHPRSFNLKGVVYSGLIGVVFLTIVLMWGFACAGNDSRAVFFRFRALELYSGSSPTLPLALLAAVAFGLFLVYLKRFSRAGFGRPGLYFVRPAPVRAAPVPALAASPAASCLREMSRHYREINGHIMAPAQPGYAGWSRRLIVSGGLLLFYTLVFRPLRYMTAFEVLEYNIALIASTSMLMFALATSCYDLLLIWRGLERLLRAMDVLRLRRAFDRVSQAWPRRPIWASLRILSKPLIAQQMQVALQNRRIVADSLDASRELDEFCRTMPARISGKQPGAVVTHEAGRSQPHFAPALRAYLRNLRRHETTCARLALTILVRDLVPAWDQSIDDEELAAQAHAGPNPRRDLQKYSSDFVAIQFSRYILYVVAQIKLIAWCISLLLVMLMVVLNAYTPQAPQLVGRFLMVLFLAIGLVIFQVFAAMERNPILSRLERTDPGELNREFWFQLIALGALPLIGVLSHLFPSVGGFISSWVAPSIEALH